MPIVYWGQKPLKYASSIRRWNPTAKQCYRRGCICEGCPIKEYAPTLKVCHMKESVLELVRQYGIPPDLRRKNFLIED